MNQSKYNNDAWIERLGDDLKDQDLALSFMARHKTLVGDELKNMRAR